MVVVMRPLTEKSSPSRPRIAFALRDDGIIVYAGRKRDSHLYSIDVMDLSIVRHIASEEALKSRDVLTLAYMAYLYTLRLTDTRSIRRLTTVDRDVVTSLKNNIFEDFDIVRYKIATLRCVCMGLTPSDSKEISRQFKLCGLRKVDGFLFHMLYLNDDLVDFVKAMNSIEDKDFVLDVDTLPSELTYDAVKEFKKAAAYHANKIRFVAAANRFHINDLKSELESRAIQAYYWVRPFYPKLHAVNYAKRACQGHAHNMREYYQSPDRARAINTGEGYDNAQHAIDENLSTYDSIYDEENKVIEMIDERMEYAV